MRLCCRRIHTQIRAYTPDDKCPFIPQQQWTPTNNCSSSPNVGYVLIDPIQTLATSFQIHLLMPLHFLFVRNAIMPLPLPHYCFAHTKIVGLATNPGSSSVHPHHSTPTLCRLCVSEISHTVPVPVAIATVCTIRFRRGLVARMDCPIVSIFAWLCRLTLVKPTNDSSEYKDGGWVAVVSMA